MKTIFEEPSNSFQPQPAFAEFRYSDTALTQASAASQVQALLYRRPGIDRIDVDHESGQLSLTFDPRKVDARQAETWIREELDQLRLEEVGQESESVQKPADLGGNPLKELLAGLGLPRRLSWYAKGLSVISTVLKLVAPLCFGFIIVVAVTGGLEPLAKLGLESMTSQMLAFCVAYYVLKTLDSYSEYLRKKAWSVYAQRSEQAIRLNGFRHIVGLDMAYLENQNTDKLIHLLSTEVGKIRQYIDYTPAMFIEKSLTLILGSTVMMLASVQALVLILVPLPLVFLLNRRHQLKMAEAHKDHSVHTDEFNQFLANNLQGLATIKSFTSEEREIERLKSSSEQLYSSNLILDRGAAWISSATSFVFALGISLPLVYGCVALTLNMMAFANFMIVMSITPILLMATTGIDYAIKLREEALLASRRLWEVLKVESRILDGNHAQVTDDIQGSIGFEGITFGYGEKKILEEVDLQIAPEKTVAFVGPTGSGKTTITKLLLRFHDVQGGMITLDNSDIRTWVVGDLRRVIGVVSQDTYLFNGTVYENILYGRPDATREEVIAASRAAEAYDFINEMPEGFESKIGERGQKLSGGQRQRISIARTMLKNPPILIFDEATSAVDNETEAAIQRSIEAVSRNRITIMIAHRLSTVRKADCIYVLKHGGIIESGTHEELLRVDGEYANLWNMQLEKTTC